MAKQQLTVQTVDKECIIKFVNSFIKAYGLKVYDGNNIVKTDNINLTEFNKKTKQIYNGITSEKDIIWIKFADNRVGVVACSNDVNFDIPSTKDEYDEIIFTRNGKKGKEGKKQRHDIETGIGNYLILNDVPIIDYYSHRI